VNTTNTWPALHYSHQLRSQLDFHHKYLRQINPSDQYCVSTLRNTTYTSEVVVRYPNCDKTTINRKLFFLSVIFQLHDHNTDDTCICATYMTSSGSNCHSMTILWHDKYLSWEPPSILLRIAYLLDDCKSFSLVEYVGRKFYTIESTTSQGRFVKLNWWNIAQITEIIHTKKWQNHLCTVRKSIKISLPSSYHRTWKLSKNLLLPTASPPLPSKYPHQWKTSNGMLSSDACLCSY